MIRHAPLRSIPALPTLAWRSLLPALAPRPPAVFPLDHLEGDRASLHYLARNGIYHGLGAIGLGGGAVVLMPSYHHGVEVEAVRAAGCEVRFFGVGRDLVADLDDARRRADGARALYLIHYAGFAQPLDEARALCRERGLVLVEDCALSLLSRAPSGEPLGAAGDLSVFCLYKTLPLPHGGVAVGPAALPLGRRPPLLSTLHHVAGSLRAHAALERGPMPLWDAARALARRSVDRVVRAEQTGTRHLDPAQLDLGVSALVERLLTRIDADGIVVRRRRNYRRLLDALGDERRAVAGPLAAGACPLFFPLLVADKAAARARMEQSAIECVDFWSDGDPACDAALFADTAWLRRHVLEVPIHQDLDDESLDQVARAVKEEVAACPMP